MDPSRYLSYQCHTHKSSPTSAHLKNGRTLSMLSSRVSSFKMAGCLRGPGVTRASLKCHKRVKRQGWFREAVKRVCVCVWVFCEMRSATFGVWGSKEFKTFDFVLCVMSKDNDNDRGRFLLVLCCNHITLLQNIRHSMKVRHVFKCL